LEGDFLDSSADQSRGIRKVSILTVDARTQSHRVFVIRVAA